MRPNCGSPTLVNIVVLCVGLFLASRVVAAAQVNADTVLAAINGSRTQNGRRPLSLDPRLSAAAASKLADMRKRAYFGHVNPDGQYVWALVKQHGCAYRHVGENLASDYDDRQRLEEAWMRSAAHRNNILDRHYGVAGVAVSGRPPLVVVLFADSCR